MKRMGGLLVALTKNWVRSREAVFFSLMFPIILLIVFSAVFGGGSGEFTVYVQNNDVGSEGEATNLSSTFVESLERTEVLSVRTIDPNRNITEWSRENQSGTKRVVVISDGFSDRVRSASRRARMSVIRDTLDRFSGQINDSEIIQGLSQTGSETNATVSAEVVFMAASDDEAGPAVRGIIESLVARFNNRATGVDQPPVTVKSEDLGSRDLEGADYYLPALIATVVVINGVITVTSTVAGFNQDGTLKRLVATPLRRRDWIAANVIQQSVLALIITGIMVVIAHLLFGVTAIPGPLSLILILVGAVGFSALGVGLGSMLDDQDTATSLGNAIALPLMFISGVFWEIDLMPEYLQTVAEASPLYHFHQGLRQLMIVGTKDGVLVPFAVLGVGAVGALIFAIKATDWHDF